MRPPVVTAASAAPVPPSEAPGSLTAQEVMGDEIWNFVFDSETLARRTRVSALPDASAPLFSGPGFCDLQCNGFAGVDFNDPDQPAERIAAAIRALWAHGCTTVLPTVVTNTPDHLEAVLQNLVRALHLDPEVAASVAGFHLEGPFISPVEGARGAHPAASISPFRPAWWRRWQAAAEGRICLVTHAPEIEGAAALRATLRAEGVLIAIGHTMATEAQITTAVAGGALLSTHLGNGCPQILPRHANPIWAQAGEDRLQASLIADGIHLPPSVLRSLVRAKQGGYLLVTDAMAAAGAPPGRYRLGALEVEVGEDRVVRLPGKPLFAGSALTMDRAVAGLRTMAGVSWAEAWQAASERPLRLLRRVRPAAAAGENFVLAKLEGDTLQVVKTVRSGRVLWSKT